MPDKDDYKNGKNVTVIMWLLGIISLSAGCDLQWGHGAGMIAFGGTIILWPLLRQFVAQRQP